MGCGYFQNKTNRLKLNIDIRGIVLYYPSYNERQKMSKEKLIEELKGVLNIQQVESNTDFIVSWHAKKYNKIIWRVGNLNKEGCRTWESDGKKYMCFWDTVLERYTTCIDPMITYKRKVS